MEGEEWDELQRNLMATIPVYDRINRFATLGQVSRWRKMVRQKLPQGRVLEIGCGPGSFAEDVVGRDLVCVDPIPEMLSTAEKRVNSARAERGDSPAEFVESTAEDSHSRMDLSTPFAHFFPSGIGMTRRRDFPNPSGS